MKISVISDLHAARKDNVENKGASLLRSFLCNPKVLDSDIVVFLGDIFDFMVGGFEEYKNNYSDFFNFLDTCSEKKIYFIEGNHDFLCQKLFLKYKNFIYLTRPETIVDNGVKIYLSHGDNPALSNLGYKMTKNILNNFIVNFIVNHLINYRVLSTIGNFLSAKSREININKYGPNTINLELRNFYINFAKELFVQKINIVILGHNHIHEFFQEEDCFYINNGFPQQTGFFTYVEDGRPMLMSIL